MVVEHPRISQVRASFFWRPPVPHATRSHRINGYPTGVAVRVFVPVNTVPDDFHHVFSSPLSASVGRMARISSAIHSYCLAHPCLSTILTACSRGGAELANC